MLMHKKTCMIPILSLLSENRQVLEPYQNSYIEGSESPTINSITCTYDS